MLCVCHSSVRTISIAILIVVLCSHLLCPPCTCSIAYADASSLLPIVFPQSYVPSHYAHAGLEKGSQHPLRTGRGVLWGPNGSTVPSPREARPLQRCIGMNNHCGTLMKTDQRIDLSPCRLSHCLVCVSCHLLPTIGFHVALRNLLAVVIMHAPPCPACLTAVPR